MQYIDKLKHLHQHNEYTRDYLRMSSEGCTHAFIPSLTGTDTAYDAFNQRAFRQGVPPYRTPGFEHILREEQNHLCCYCMGRLGQKVTLEHIIPRSLCNDTPQSRSEYKYYADYSDALNKGVLLNPVFEQAYNSKSMCFCLTEQMPHQVAYANLTASCLGLLALGDGDHKACCCNGYRGNNRIIPLMLIKGVEDLVVYGDDGSMAIKGQFTLQEREDTMKYLGLNNKTLKQIRSIWHGISTRFDAIPDLTTRKTEVERIMLLIMALGPVFKSDVNGKNEYKKFVNNDVYWDMLSRYDWFYGYYKNKKLISSPMPTAWPTQSSASPCTTPSQPPTSTESSRQS